MTSCTEPLNSLISSFGMKPQCSIGFVLMLLIKLCVKPLDMICLLVGLLFYLVETFVKLCQLFLRVHVSRLLVHPYVNHHFGQEYTCTTSKLTSDLTIPLKASYLRWSRS